MESPKRALGLREIVSLAYANNQGNPKWKRQEKRSVPGPLFDAFVIGTFLVLVIGYYM